MAQKLNFGELSSGESFSCKKIIWKIFDVFSLPKHPDYVVMSPEFSFANATWVLSMYPYGQTMYESESSVDFMIHRTHSLIPEHEVGCYCFLEMVGNREFQPFSSYPSFTPKFGRKFLVRSFMKHSDLAEKQIAIAPEGNLTVVCQMRVGSTAEVPPQLLRSIESEIALRTSSSTTPPAPNKKVLQDLEELFSSRDGSDVTIKVRGHEFEAHRALLRARSPVFASMLMHDMKEKNTGLINIEDCDPETFPDFLRFLYCGSVESITPQNVFSLYSASDKYDVQDLKSECRAYMKGHISVDNFCNTVALAVRHGEKDLIKQATDFFTRNMKKIILTVKWQVFLAENPTEGNELFIKAVGADKS